MAHLGLSACTLDKEQTCWRVSGSSLSPRTSPTVSLEIISEQELRKDPDLMAQAWDPSAQEAQAGESL